MKKLLCAVLGTALAAIAGCSKSPTPSSDAKTASAEMPEQQILDIVNAANAKDSAKVASLLKSNPKLVEAKFNRGGPVDGWPLVMIAARNGDNATLAVLIKAGADVNATNYSEETALHYAVSGGHKEIVNALLLAKANAQVKNAVGVTPLKIATSAGKPDIATLLKKAGAKE